MKKLLIASTALVATASVAAADVAFSGYGRFGILYEENRTNDGTTDGVNNPTAAEETRLESRFRLNIDGSTETDGGIRFAARMRVEANDNTNGSAAAGAFSGARFQVSAGGLRVRVGNISGVADSGSIVNTFGYEPGLIGQVGQYGTFAGGSLPVTAFSSTGAGANGINVLYEMGDFAVMASWNDDYDQNLQGGVNSFDEQFEIGARYTFSGWTLGVVFGQIEQNASAATATRNAVAAADVDWWIATASGSIGAADVSVFIGDTDIAGDDVAYGVSGSIPVGAATNVVASVAGGGANALNTEYGIGVTHSLGGGVTLKGMVGNNQADNTVADLGVVFNF